MNTRGFTGHCLEVHDLAASKLAAFREKDREFLRILLRERLVQSNKLIRHINLLPVSEERRNRYRRWVDGTERELASG
jgi:hypothetical protein